MQTCKCRLFLTHRTSLQTYNTDGKDILKIYNISITLFWTITHNYYFHPYNQWSWWNQTNYDFWTRCSDITFELYIELFIVKTNCMTHRGQSVYWSIINTTYFAKAASHPWWKLGLACKRQCSLDLQEPPPQTGPRSMQWFNVPLDTL